MKYSRNLVGACLSAALLAACGGGNVLSPSTPASIGTPLGSRTLAVFNYSGRAQKFIVPTGMTELTIVVRGASGGGATSGSYGAAPGLGGGLKARIPVTPGERLIIYVGGEGGAGSGGFNGGGAPGHSGFGGGGASDVRQGGKALSNRVLVAAGGGGQGSGAPDYGYGGGAGGSGGGKTGGAGETGGGSLPGYGGSGGTQSVGGSGGQGEGGGSAGCKGQQGDTGSSGAGGDGGNNPCAYPGGGGGGGGDYGGGGGGSSGPDCYTSTLYGNYYCITGGGGGGGGGSSYAEPSATHVVYHQGVWGPGNGQVVIHRSP